MPGNSAASLNERRALGDADCRQLSAGHGAMLGAGANSRLGGGSGRRRLWLAACGHLGSRRLGGGLGGAHCLKDYNRAVIHGRPRRRLVGAREVLSVAVVDDSAVAAGVARLSKAGDTRPADDVGRAVWAVSRTVCWGVACKRCGCSGAVLVARRAVLQPALRRRACRARARAAQRRRRPGHGAPPRALQKSPGGSQQPRLGRHTTVLFTNASAGQLAELPVQYSATSQTPPLGRHTVVLLLYVCGWHAPDTPSQTAGSSHLSTVPLQTVPLGKNTLLGQDALLPVQFSAGSHGPVLGLHTVVLGLKPLSGHTLELPVQ